MHILFICTGNICRSPMAEGIARDRYPELATYSSAGTMAIRGSAPTGAAIDAAAESGVDIAELRGLSLSSATDPLPDRIYVMTRRHRDRVANALPGLEERIELLDAAGEIADPYGLDLDFYRATRDQIAAAIDVRAKEWMEATA